MAHLSKARKKANLRRAATHWLFCSEAKLTLPHEKT
jgi:hypothetical protein